MSSLRLCSLFGSEAESWVVPITLCRNRWLRILSDCSSVLWQTEDLGESFIGAWCRERPRHPVSVSPNLDEGDD